MKRLFSVMLLALFTAVYLPYNVYAGEVDILLQKLVEKGVLTPGEAQQVGTETKEQVKKEISQGKSFSLPAWVQNIKLKGDLRLRYQYKHEKATGDTNIGRVRARLGLEDKVNEKILAGIGIATGSGDPRSTNISFGDYNSKKTLVLDYAYAKYNALPWLTLVGGKMYLNDTLWEPTDLIWDTDITPEGAVIQLNKNVNPNLALSMNLGALIVSADSSSDNDAPMAYIIQPQASYKFNDNLSLKGALSFQSFHNVKGHACLKYASGSNTGITKIGSADATGNYVYDYQMLNPALEFKVIQPFKALGLNIETLRLFGEYVNNLDVSKGASGFSLGFQFGNDKVEKWGDWQFRYVYAMLQKDAVLDVLPDSDRYSGKTGMRSHEGSLAYGLGKNVSLGLDVYRSWSIIGAKAPETLIQTDLNMKF